MQILLNLLYLFLLLEGMIVEVEHKKLRQDMEVFLVVGKTFTNQVVNRVNLLELYLILVADPDDLQNILLHNFVMVNWLLAFLVVNLLKS